MDRRVSFSLSLPEGGDSHLAAASSRMAKDTRPMQANAAASLITVKDTTLNHQSVTTQWRKPRRGQPASLTYSDMERMQF